MPEEFTFAQAAQESSGAPPENEQLAPPSEAVGEAVVDAGQPAEAAVPPASSMSRVEMARELGFDVADNATDEVIEQSLQEFQALARFGHQFKQNPQQFADYIQPAQPVQQPATQPQTQPPAKDPFEWPTIDRNLLAMVTQDEETGVVRGKNEFVSPQVIQQVSQYLEKRAEYHEKFYENPVKYTFDRLKEPLLQEAREMLRQEMAQQQYETQRQAFEQEIGEKYYAQDDKGHYLVNPATGQYAASPWGTAYMQAMQGMQAAGSTDILKMERQAAKFADQITGGAKPIGQQKSPPTPAQISEQKKESFLESAGSGASNNRFAEHDGPPVYTDEDLNQGFFMAAGRAAGLVVD